MNYAETDLPLLDKIFSKYEFGFWKGFSVQHCSIAKNEKCFQSLDSGSRQLQF